MGPPLYTQSVVDRNVLMRHMTVQLLVYQNIFTPLRTIRNA
jgi:hypothetical protein